MLTITCKEKLTWNKRTKLERGQQKISSMALFSPQYAFHSQRLH